MESTISPDLGVDDRLRAAVERADAALLGQLRGPIGGRSWQWLPAGNGSALLVMSYEGNTSSRSFTLEELERPGDVVWAARDLWADVLVANIRRTGDQIVGLLREVAHDELLQGA